MDILGYNLSLAFWGNVKLFSKAVAAFYIPVSNVWGFQFLHIFANTCYCLSLLLYQSRKPTFTFNLLLIVKLYSQIMWRQALDSEFGKFWLLCLICFPENLHLLLSISSIFLFLFVSFGFAANNSAPALEAGEKSLAGPCPHLPRIWWINTPTMYTFPVSSPCPTALSEALNKGLTLLLHFFFLNQ